MTGKEKILRQKEERAAGAVRSLRSDAAITRSPSGASARRGESSDADSLPLLGSDGRAAGETVWKPFSGLPRQGAVSLLGLDTDNDYAIQESDPSIC